MTGQVGALAWGLSRNVALPLPLLGELVERAPVHVLEEIAEAARLTRDMALRLVERGDASVGARLAHRDVLRPADFEHPPDPWVVFGLLEHGPVPDAWLTSILSHDDPMLRGRLADTAHRPAWVIRQLANDPDPQVVAEAGLWARTPDELIPELAEHPHAAVRRAVAANEHTQSGVLEFLAGPGASAGLETCEACPGEPLEGQRWCDGSHEGAVAEIRAAGGHNPSTPPQPANDSPRSTVTTRYGSAPRDVPTWQNRHTGHSPRIPNLASSPPSPRTRRSHPTSCSSSRPRPCTTFGPSSLATLASHSISSAS
jgi:hypothetical protein